MVATTVLVSRTDNNNNTTQSTPSTQHTYGTRTRQNSIIRPSTRLRQFPDSSGPQQKLKLLSNIRAKPGTGPQAPAYPVFPPPNVMLHSEDANNKVLMAIGRSFLSVDNRAMTIKDLAEMCMTFGLMCQSASAAGQAITSFIRSHMQRCETEQDQPLLLKHILSGTPSDDDLVSALHSRSGGAHCTITNGENRLTNFRRGTMIWYLSKAAGAPCPFARAGIRLCNYKESGEIKQERHCGQKRKRSLRARSFRGGSDSEDITSETEIRAPKVKLTLRLKPPRTFSVSSAPSSISDSTSSVSSACERSTSVIDLSKDSDIDDSVSVDHSDDDDHQLQAGEEESIFPPYPRQSISIPAYTPSVEDLYPELFPSAMVLPSFRRSPSVPRSVASPPPDSDDEEELLSNVAARRRHSSAFLRPSFLTNEFSVEFCERGDELDLSTRGSPVPHSPWTPFTEEGVFVKEEPNDVGGILKAWESFDNVSNVVNINLFTPRSPFDLEVAVKAEELNDLSWGVGLDSSESEGYPNATDEAEPVFVKEEDVDNPITLPDSSHVPNEGLMSELLSAIEPSYRPDHCIVTDARRHVEILWKDVELLGPDSVHLQDFEDGHWLQPRISTSRTRAHTSPSLFASFVDPARASHDSCSSDRQTNRESGSMISTRVTESTLSIEASDQTVVHTTRHFTPAICLAQVDGVSIYQLVIDSHHLLRRFDTDFVNLSRIAEFSGQPTSSLEAVSSGKDIVEGCPLIRGKWVSLERARNFVNGCSSTHGVLDIFLSLNLYEQFPPCVQTLHRSHQDIRSCNQFGPPFRSMVQDSRPFLWIDDTSWERAHWDDDHLILVHPSLGAKSNTMDLPLPALEEGQGAPETPLSPTEQEIFHSLCASSEWDNPDNSPSDVAVDSGKENEAICPVERMRRTGRARALRRSKRVADAIASRSRTRSAKTRANML